MHLVNDARLSTNSTGLAAGNPSDDALLQRLLPLWREHHGRGLEVRHTTGLVLNSKFGPPTGRQAYGSATLKGYSEQLNVSESELSRMRWFAHHFQSLEEFKAKQPQVKTWTQVKELLVTLRQPEGAKPESPAGDDKKLVRVRPSHPVAKVIQSARESLAGIELKPGDGQWEEVNAAVEEFLADVGKCLGTRYHREPAPAREKTILAAVPAGEILTGSPSQMTPLPA